MKLRIKRSNYYYYGFCNSIDRVDNTLQYLDENDHWQDVPKTEIEYVNLKTLTKA